MLIFGDFETTGLDPDRDLPLELGLVLVNDALEEVSQHRIVFGYTPEEISEAQASCAPVVREMHEKNGLWQDLLDPEVLKTDPTDLDLRLYGWAHKHHVEGNWPTQPMARRPELAGFNPAFDLRWLRRYAPSFVQDKLHYRPFNVSTLRDVVRLKYGCERGPSGEPEHRGVADCLDALKYLRWFRVHVMSPYNLAGT